VRCTHYKTNEILKFTIPSDREALQGSPPDAATLGFLPAHLPHCGLFYPSEICGGESEWFNWTPNLLELFYLTEEMHEERFITWTPYGKRKQIYERILNSLVLCQHGLLSHACVSIHIGPGTQSMEESIRKWCDHDHCFGGSWISTWSKCKTTSFPARNVPRTLSPDPALTRHGEWAWAPVSPASAKDALNTVLPPVGGRGAVCILSNHYLCQI